MQECQANEQGHLVFVYGTLKSGECFNFVLTDAKNGKASLVGPARTVKKWPMVLVSSNNIPCLLPYEGIGHEVLGEVYDVDDEMLTFLDRMEGHPDHYVRVLQEVELLSELLQAGTKAESTPNSSIQLSKTPGRIFPSSSPRKAWMYTVRNPEEKLLSLPHIANYTGKGGIRLPSPTGERSRRILSSLFRDDAKSES